MRIPENARPLILIVALAIASIAFAQPPVYESPALGFRIGLPNGWAASEDVSPDGTVVLQFAVPSGQGAIGLVAAPIPATDRAYWTGPRDQLVRDVWEGFLPEVPGAQITQTYEIALAGTQASVIDYASPTVAGTIVLVIGDVATVTLFSAADQASYATAQSGLEALVASFGFLGGAGPAGSTGVPDAAGGPGAVTPPPAPNPLGGGGSAVAPAADPHVGVYADERLQLTLAAAAEGLAGELVFDGARYPVTARVQGGTVAGHFLAGGTSYGFDAQLVGDTLTFVTDDARYELRRVR